MDILRKVAVEEMAVGFAYDGMLLSEHDQVKEACKQKFHMVAFRGSFFKALNLYVVAFRGGFPPWALHMMTGNQLQPFLLFEISYYFF